MNVIQVVLRLPPAINELGEYGLSLACQFYKNFNTKTHFIISDSNWVGKIKFRGLLLVKQLSA